MKTPQVILSYTLVLGLALTSALCANTAFNIHYDFTGTPIASPTTVTGDAQGSAMAWHGFSAQFGFSSTTDTAYVRADQTVNSLDLTQYLEFTITADSADVLNLDSIVFNLGGSSNSALNSATTYSVLRAGAPTADFSDLSDLILTPGPTTTASNFVPTEDITFTTYTADLSGDAYQGVSALTFRFYVYDTSNSNTIFLRFNDFTVNGTTTAIPENNTSALLGALGALLLALWWRRRKNANPA